MSKYATTDGLSRIPNRANWDYRSLEEAFPNVDPETQPLGERVLLQLRMPKTHYGQLVLPQELQDTDMWNSQVGKVIAVGALAFHNRDTGKSWVEGAWVKVGDYVRMPKYGGDRYDMPGPDGRKVTFVTLKDLDLISLIVGDPLKVVAFI